MEIKIPVKNKRDLFEKYLLFLNPLIKIKETVDIPILASLMIIIYKYKNYPEKNLYDCLFSDETKKYIGNGLNISEVEYDRSLKRMKKRKVITEDNKINDRILSIIHDNKKEIDIKFNVEKEKKF
jgi:hypothetical protein